MDNQELLSKAERIEIVNIRRGDTLVLTMRPGVNPTFEDRGQIVKQLHAFFPGIQILVLNECDLSVVREGN